MRATLRVRPGEAEPFDAEIANTATIGRSPDNTISLAASPHVSRQHAIIRCHNAWQYQIMDLGSRNGTFVNGRRVITPTLLTHGAIIRIASNEITFEQPEDQAQGTVIEATLAAGTDHGDEQSATVAIMVCDLRGFSTMSEILPEEQLAKTLGEWFRDAGNLVQSNGGTIDKFIGDAMLAYWELGPAESTSAALRTGHGLLDKSRAKRWPGPAPKAFDIAVALHYGNVTCGNIGLVAQRDATIIGDSVNTTFRIESVMKPLGQRMVMSADFLEASGRPASDYADLGDHQLKGKNQPVRLFGLRPGDTGSTAPLK